MQQGMLFHALRDAGTGIYVTQVSLTLTEVDKGALRSAWTEVLRRHDVLRTSFVWQTQDKLLQVVRRDVTLPWQELDWRDLDTAERAEKLEAFLAEDRARGFDLRAAPLMRLTLIATGGETCELVWSHHHLVLDGWSIGLVLKDVVALYQAVKQGVRAAVPSPRPYQDFIAWLQRQDAGKAETFWRRELSGFSAPTRLSIERSSEGGGEAGERWHQLSGALTAGLKGFAAAHGLTLSTVLHGAWAILLSRYSGEEDVLFGSVASGRPAELAGAEAMVGMFINTLSVRTQVRSDAGVAEWLRQLQEHLIDLRGYEYSLLVNVQGWSGVPRGAPLFESLLAFENYPLDPAVLRGEGGLAIEDVRSVERLDTPLSLAVIPGEQLRIRVLWDGARFDAESVLRLLGHLEVLLRAMVAEPAATLGRLPLLTASERERVVAEWNATAADYPRDVCLHELIAEQAARTPLAPAVVCEGRVLSYAELEGKANQLAQHLRGLGVGPDVVVGLYVERSLEMVIGLLGILKAGGAYLPLDPEYPADRLAFMLETAAAPVVVTVASLADQLPPHAARLVRLDADWRQIADLPATVPESGVGPSHLAYVIFTSGSTGRPKGVMNQHGGLVNRLWWMQAAHGLTGSDSVLQKTPFTFDVSVWEFLWPLMFGARLVMARPGGHREPGYLVDVICREKITTLHFVPSMLQVFLQEAEVERCTSIKRVICSGEALSGALQEEFFKRLSCELHNLYGPTEAAIDVTYWACRADDHCVAVPIGRPIWNTQIYILDAALSPVPVGIAGELYIGGVGVARGYVGRPDLTAERFIADPFSSAPGARLYRTGDLARWRADGTIEYLGRLDHQVKVRGLRIELGEIEASLKRHAGVRDAVVVVREDVPGDKRLVAYVVGAGPTLPVEELRELLTASLPDYMVPSAFVVLAELPLSHNGKLDRKALPAPDISAARGETSYVAPRSNVEVILADIWAKILGVEKIGIGDDFFSIGGHSLAAVRVVNAVNRKLHLNLGVASIFQYRTIERFAASIGQSEQAAVICMRDGGAGAPIYTVYAGTHEHNIAKLIEGHTVFGIDAPLRREWRIAAEQDRFADLPDMDALIAPYVDALRRHAGSRPCILAGYCFAGVMAFALAQRFKAEGGRVERLILIDAAPRVPTVPEVVWWHLRSAWGNLDEPAAALERAWRTGRWLAGQGVVAAWNKFRRVGGTVPPGLITTLRDEDGKFIEWRTLLRVYAKIYQTYAPRPLDVPGFVMSFRADGETERLYRELDPSMGWGELFVHRPRIIQVDGTHNQLGEHESDLSQQLMTILEPAQTASAVA
jgi:amino acid adenylation domain-containing protein